MKKLLVSLLMLMSGLLLAFAEPCQYYGRHVYGKVSGHEWDALLDKYDCYMHGPKVYENGDRWEKMEAEMEHLRWCPSHPGYDVYPGKHRYE